MCVHSPPCHSASARMPPHTRHRYSIDIKGVRSLEAKLCQSIASLPKSSLEPMRLLKATDKQLKGFVHHTVRGFLRQDLYTAMSEFLLKAQGSFGVQAHSPAEPGVVVIGSKGQPMAVSFRLGLPMFLFASETAALDVSMVAEGEVLEGAVLRLDLDSEGEVMRVGVPSALLHDAYSPFCGDGSSSPSPMAALPVARNAEIRCYSVLHLVECSASELLDRLIRIGGSSRPFSLPMPIDKTVFTIVAEGEEEDEGQEEEEDVEASAGTTTKGARETAGTVPPSSAAAQGSRSRPVVTSISSILGKLQAGEPAQDLVARDIADIPRVIREVRTGRYGHFRAQASSMGELNCSPCLHPSPSLSP